jgi:hypothetical protein
LAADTVPESALTAVETRNSNAEHSSGEAINVHTAGQGPDGDKATDIPEARASPGRAGIRISPSKIMSAIEPQHPNPFGSSPVNTSHINAGMPHTGVAQLRGGVTMSRSVTAEGMQEAEEIMGGKELALQEASKKLAASVAANPRQVDDDEDEEAKDSLGFDLVIPSRTLARKVSPTSTNGIPKYGRSTSAPAGERLSPPNANGYDRFGRKPSVKGPIGGGLARSGSKLRTSVYGLADVSAARIVDGHDLMLSCFRSCTRRKPRHSRNESQHHPQCIQWTPSDDRPTRFAIRRRGIAPRVSSCHKPGSLPREARQQPITNIATLIRT